MAALLRQAGYATGICGKWGLGGPASGSTPNDKGFDFFFGYNCQRHAHRYYTDYLYRNTERIEIPQSPRRRVYLPDLITQESLEFIRRNKDRPFFLYCAWTLPHGPWGTGQVPSLGLRKHRLEQRAEKVYAAMVERLDSDVGRVMATLADLGLDDHTLVIFASDNGATEDAELEKRFDSAAGLRGAKGELLEGGIRVPMIARWPGHVPVGRTSGFATAFGTSFPRRPNWPEPPPGAVDGLSILPTLLGRQQSPHAYLYWEQIEPSDSPRPCAWAPGKATRAAAGSRRSFTTSQPTRENPGTSRRSIRTWPERSKRSWPNRTPTSRSRRIDPRVWKKYEEDNRKLDALLRGDAQPGTPQAR